MRVFRSACCSLPKHKNNSAIYHLLPHMSAVLESTTIITTTIITITTNTTAIVIITTTTTTTTHQASTQAYLKQYNNYWYAGW